MKISGEEVLRAVCGVVVVKYSYLEQNKIYTCIATITNCVWAGAGASVLPVFEHPVYKIFKTGSFSHKAVFLCLVELPGNKKFQGHKFRKD